MQVIICTLYGPYRVLCRVLQRDYTECSVYWLPSTRQSTTLYALFEQVHRALCEGASQHHTDHSVSHVLDTLQSTLCAMFQIAYRVWGHQCLEEYEYYVSLVWSSTQSTLQTQFQISYRGLSIICFKDNTEHSVCLFLWDWQSRLHIKYSVSILSDTRQSAL